MGRNVPGIWIKSVREVFAGSYRIIYNLSKDKTIEILAIRHLAKPLSEF
jgi:plasmid stabilization system protein ParE